MKAVASLKEELATARGALAEARFDAPGHGGRWLASELTSVIDQLIGRILHSALDGKGNALNEHVAVVALGGYGRGELSPHSDVDLLFLVDQPPKDATFLDAILYPLWDLGLELGYAVRTIEETVEAARKEQATLSALLDARLLSGASGELLMAELERDAIERLIGGQAGERFIEAKLEERRVRRERFGDSVYLLEPNVKEGLGGLRDLHAALWVARSRWKARTIRDLVRASILSSREARSLERAHDFLLRVRAELHLAAGRRQDTLSFADQEQIAETMRLGRKTEGALGTNKHRAERFMRAYYFHARMSRINTGLIIERATSHRLRRSTKARRSIRGFSVWNDTLTLARRNQLHDNPAEVVRLFRVSAEESLDIYSYTKDLVWEALPKIDRDVRRQPGVVKDLLAIIEVASAEGSTLEVMHDLGVLRRLIPELSRITARWQHSLYHVYTVDIHSLKVVKNLRMLKSGGFGDGHRELERMMNDLLRPTVIYMAGLLHDVGKGWRRGDHSVRGAQVAQVVGERFEDAQVPDWTAEDTADLVWLVKDHLRMSSISQRRDVSDPALIEAFSDDVRTVERLTMLHLLTVADMKGTSPTVWTEWKGALLRQLFVNARQYLRARSTGDAHRPSHATRRAHLHMRRQKVYEELRRLADAAGRDGLKDSDLEAFIAAMPSRYLLSIPARQMLAHMRMWRDVSRGTPIAMNVRHLRHDDASELTIVCGDHPGLLAQLAGSVAVNGMGILSAQIFSISLMGSEPSPSGSPRRAALDILHVARPSSQTVHDADLWARLKADIERVLGSPQGVDDLVNERLSTSDLGRRHRPEVESKAHISNDESEDETVIDVYCEDKAGALYKICAALAQQGLTISLAKISTEGGRVVDSFYVTEAVHGGQVPSERFAKIREQILDAVE